MHSCFNTSHFSILRYLKCFIAFTLLATQVAYAEQTGHVYGLYDRTNYKVALVNATAVTEPGVKMDSATVVINNGVIVSVESNGAIPEDAQVIDLKGHWLYAGFIDPYSDYVYGETKSYPSWGDPPKYEGDRQGGNAWNDAIHSHINWADDFMSDSDSADKMIKNGFTTVQAARMDGIFQGRAVTVSLADDIPNNLIYRADARHFGSFNKGSSKQSYPSSLMGSIALIRQTLSDAVWYQDAKGKVDTLFSAKPVEYNSALESLLTLQESGIVFDAGDSLSTLRAHEIFNRFDVNAVYLGDGLEYSRLTQLKDIGATFILPLNYPKTPSLGSFEAQLDTSLAELRHVERAPGNPSSLERADIPFAFTQHGLKDKKDFWTALNKSIKHGLSETAALAALTTVPAQIAGVDAISGKIAPGFKADLVVADGNLFDGGKIKKVFLQGKAKQYQEILPYPFAGQYEATLKDAGYTLILERQKDELTGTISTQQDNSKDIKLSNIQATGDQISFTFELTENNVKTVYGFSGRLSKNNINGYWLLPDLTRVPAQLMSKTLSDETGAADNLTASETSSEIEYISSITYPNRAFGLTKQPAQQNLHIQNATIWTSEDAGVLENTDMIIKDGKIKEIGEDLNTPSGYTAIDATNKHVTAGIIDEHSHIAISGGVNEGSDAVTSEVRIGDVINPEDINIYRALAGGTTAAQLLHGSANPIGGQAQVIKLRWGEDANGLKFAQAPPSIKFALGENVKQSNWGDKFTIRYPQTRMGVDTIVRDIMLRAREYQESFEKYKRLSRSEKKTVAPPRQNYRLDALIEIMDSERFIHAHSYVASEILALMALAEDFGFTIQTFTHILEGYKVADEMAKHGASASSFSDWWAYKFEVFDAIPGNTCLMMDKGVNVSVNSDSGDLIRRLNTEAAKSINYCDMDPLNAIKMVTINPAKQLKIDQYTGSLAEGKDADFVIWNDNPLSIYAKVEQTWIDGRNYFDVSLDAELKQALMEEKSKLIQKLLASADSQHSHSSKPAPTTQFARYLTKFSATAGHSHKHSNAAAGATGSTSFASYLLKDNTVWHCDDNFDYWHYISNRQTRHAHAGGHH